jgi:hypothetical protein
VTTQPPVPEFDVTVGELFPADDIVGQWVFTLNGVADDLDVVMRALKNAQADGEIQAQMFFYRLLVARLYEARRLIKARSDHPEIKDFTKTGLKWAGTDLVSIYTRPSQQVKSEVEKLFDTTRHRSVHYPEVGQPELSGLLADYQKFPARMVFVKSENGRFPQNQWVSVVRAQDCWGAQPWDAQLLGKMGRFGGRVGAIVAAWLMANTLFTIIQAKRRGIDLGRLVESPDEVRQWAERNAQPGTQDPQETPNGAASEALSDAPTDSSPQPVAPAPKRAVTSRRRRCLDRLKRRR